MEAGSAAPQLRPLGVGEILDASFKVYKARFRTLALCVLVILVPVTVVSILVQSSLSDDAFNPSPDDPAEAFDGGRLAGMGVSTLLTGLATLLATAACTRAVAAAYLGGDATWRESLAFAGRKLLPLVVATILLYLFSFLGLIAFIVGAIYVFFRLSLTTPALLVEDLGPMGALGRSWALVKGFWWRTAGTIIIVSLLAGIIAGVLQVLIVVPIISGADSELLGGILTGLSTLVSGVLTLPLQAAVIAILYFDLRVRKEGLDLHLLAQRIGAPAPAEGSFGGFAPPSSGGPEERGGLT